MAHSFGRVSYINSIPLFCAEPPFDVREAVPSKLNAAVESGALDISLISRWIYPKVAKDYAVIPDFCIGGDGEIMSVKLFSRAPLGRLGGRKIFITSESGTSIRAFRYAMVKKYKIDIFALPRADGIADADAVLLIGNRALSFDASDYGFVADLGELWKEVAEVPMIYAVAVARRGIFGEAEGEVREYFGKSLELFESQKPRWLDVAARRFEQSEGVPIARSVLEKYYSRLIYRFDGGEFEKSFKYVEALDGYIG